MTPMNFPISIGFWWRLITEILCTLRSERNRGFILIHFVTGYFTLLRHYWHRRQLQFIWFAVYFDGEYGYFIIQQKKVSKIMLPVRIVSKIYFVMYFLENPNLHYHTSSFYPTWHRIKEKSRKLSFRLHLHQRLKTPQ